MAISAREANLLLVLALIGIVGGGGLYLALPEWNKTAEKMSTKDQLAQQVTMLQGQKSTLEADLAKLKGEKLLDHVKDLNIRRYAPGEREIAVKDMLRYIILAADAASVEFISLIPAEKQPDVLVVSATPPAAPVDPNAPPAAPGTVPPAAPGAAPAPAPGAPPPAAGAAPPATPPAPGAPSADPNAPAPPPPPPPVSVDLEAIEYDFTIRGTFSEISEFIRNVNKIPDIVEINKIAIQNEGGRDRQEKLSQSADKYFNPMKPISVKASIRFFIIDNSKLDKI